MTDKEFLRRIYSVDTKAGDILSALILKARVCPEYAEDIEYDEGAFRHLEVWNVLGDLFLWQEADGGWDLFSDVAYYLFDREEDF